MGRTALKANPPPFGAFQKHAHGRAAVRSLNGCGVCCQPPRFWPCPASSIKLIGPFPTAENSPAASRVTGAATVRIRRLIDLSR
jgi:hypothetical protein